MTVDPPVAVPPGLLPDPRLTGLRLGGVQVDSATETVRLERFSGTLAVGEAATAVTLTARGVAVQPLSPAALLRGQLASVRSVHVDQPALEVAGGWPQDAPVIAASTPRENKADTLAPGLARLRDPRLAAAWRVLRERMPRVDIRISEGRLHVPANLLGKEAVALSELSLRRPPRPADGDATVSFGATVTFGDGCRGTFGVEAALGEVFPPPQVRITTTGAALPHAVASRVGPVEHVRDASFDADLRVDLPLGLVPLHVVGHVDARELAVSHRLLARQPVNGIALQGDIDLTVAPGAAEARLVARNLGGGNARTRLDVEVRRLDQRGKEAIELRWEAPRQPCQNLVADLPRGLVPRLRGMRLAGEAELRFDARVDLRRPRETLRLESTVDLDGCRIETLGPAVDVARLNTPFVHRVVEPAGVTDIRVGPGTPDYVPLVDIPRHVAAGAVVTEDRMFYQHQGVRLPLIRRALILALERGRLVYGGSTITQQLVKNLFLERGKTFARKVEEILIAWAVERELTKERILELYLNCIEYAPGVYGIARAAHFYFAKKTGDLTPVEGAFLMGLKPAPKKAYEMVRGRRFSEAWQGKIRKILRLEWERLGAISERQVAGSAPWVPDFYDAETGRHFRPRVIVRHPAAQPETP